MFILLTSSDDHKLHQYSSSSPCFSSARAATGLLIHLLACLYNSIKFIQTKEDGHILNNVCIKRERRRDLEQFYQDKMINTLTAVSNTPFRQQPSADSREKRPTCQKSNSQPDIWLVGQLIRRRDLKLHIKQPPIWQKFSLTLDKLRESNSGLQSSWIQTVCTFRKVFPESRLVCGASIPDVLRSRLTEATELQKSDDLSRKVKTALSSDLSHVECKHSSTGNIEIHF